MMAVINLILISCMVTTAIAVSPEPDYYWRDFDGTIPSDALIATSDQVSYSYIGNAGIFNGGLYVGQLYPGNTSITVTGKPSANESSKVHVVDKFVKILCTGHREWFIWYAITPDNFDSVPFHRVVGGWESFDGGRLFIGRKTEDGIMTTGKVVGYDDGIGPYLYVLEGDHESEPITQYELLVYMIPKDN